jgi:hypothetical protein
MAPREWHVSVQADRRSARAGAATPAERGLRRTKPLLTDEWVVHRTNAKQRRVVHYWFSILWFTVGLALWIALRNDLWFVGFMSLYAIWITHLAGWAAETPVEPEDES